MPINFIFPINFSKNTTKNNRECKKKKIKIVLNKFKIKIY